MQPVHPEEEYRENFYAAESPILGVAFRRRRPHHGARAGWVVSYHPDRQAVQHPWMHSSAMTG